MAKIHLSEFVAIHAWGQRGKPDRTQIVADMGASTAFLATQYENIRIYPTADVHLRFILPGEPDTPATAADDRYPGNAEAPFLLPIGTVVKHFAAS